MIVIVRSLRRRRTDILDVGESTLDVGEQTVGETIVIRFWQILPNLLLIVSVRLFSPFFFFHCKNLTSSDEGLTLETSAFKLFPVANSVVNT